MNLLLDTNAWFWWRIEPHRLRREPYALIEDRVNAVFLSVVSSWEVAIKHAQGKLSLPSPESYIPNALVQDGFVSLDVRLAHVLRAGALPMHHKDPFDRLLIAQAQLEDLAIVTADRRFSKYAVRVIRA